MKNTTPKNGSELQANQLDYLGTNGTGHRHTAPKTAPGTALEVKSVKILKDLTKLGYRFTFNEASQEIIVNGKVQSDPIAASIRVEMRDLEHTNMGALEDVYLAEAYKNRFHPIKRYFDSLQWDGKNHIADLAKYLEDNHKPICYPDTDTARSVAHVWLLRWLIGAVRKVQTPGQQNAMLVLAGAQNAGKSTFARWLCSPLPELHVESNINPDDKDHIRNLASKWIWEVAELGATTRKADVESLKSFITKMDVSYRVPYAKNPVTVPAAASFIGTINPTLNGFLTDETGSRRFMVVEITKLDWTYITAVDINQVWAQAVALCKAGEPHQLTDPEVAKREEINRTYEVVDPLEDFFQKYYFIDSSKANIPAWRIDKTSILEHLRVSGLFKDGDKSIATRVGIALKRLGVDTARFSTVTPTGHQQQRYYVGIQRQPEEEKDEEPHKGYKRHPLN